jgi:hypothetical protein
LVATCSSKRTDKLYVLRLELGQAKYFRLHVENTGLSTVRSCSGYITKITKRVGGQRIASEEEVLSLGWASYGQSDARDIPRGAFFHMDTSRH